MVLLKEVKEVKSTVQGKLFQTLTIRWLKNNNYDDDNNNDGDLDYMAQYVKRDFRDAVVEINTNNHDVHAIACDSTPLYILHVNVRKQ